MSGYLRGEIEELLNEARDWTAGKLSHWNSVEGERKDEVCAALDTAEVVRRCELIRALVAIELMEADVGGARRSDALERIAAGDPLEAEDMQELAKAALEGREPKL